jgi:AraC family transcriptional regulator
MVLQNECRKAEASCCSDCFSQAEVFQVRKSAWLRLAEANYSRGIKLPQHSHDHAGFCLLLQGLYEENWGKDIFVRKPGSLMFVASGEIHSSQIPRTGIRFLSIEIMPDLLQRVNGHSKLLRGLTQFDGGSLPWLAMRLYREFRSEDDVAPLAIEGLALELLAGVARQSSHSENGTANWLKTAKDFVRDRFQESISLTEVAEFADVHPVSLARAFRRKYGCTVGEYVRQLRIEFACQKLAGSDASLVDIALLAGFSEQSHFSRTFKRLTGLTPSEYRSSRQS